jgi:hypothetical protein
MRNTRQHREKPVTRHDNPSQDKGSVRTRQGKAKRMTRQKTKRELVETITQFIEQKKKETES